jgi:hypothetical protein
MGTFGVAMTLYTAVNILIMYFISIKITRIPIIVMSVALSVEVMLMSLFARTLMQFALIHLFMAGALVMLLFLPVMLINSSEKGWEEPENTKK